MAARRYRCGDPGATGERARRRRKRLTPRPAPMPRIRQDA